MVSGPNTGAGHPIPIPWEETLIIDWADAIELVRDTPGMYLELSTANPVFAVRAAIAEIPERTLFGSDAPYGDPLLARLTVERGTRPGQVRDLVLGGTIAGLLSW
jgi:uncharacterized protein